MKPSSSAWTLGALALALGCTVAARSAGANATFSAGHRGSNDVAAQLGLKPGPTQGLLPPMGVNPVRPDLDRLAADGTLGPQALSGQPGATQAIALVQPGSGTVEPDRGPERSIAPPIVARGGGPSAATRLRTERFPLALPLGCTRVSAVGTPNVSNTALTVRGPSLEQHRDARKGPSEAMQVCTRQAGPHDLTVQMRGSRQGVMASQLFVDRQPEVAQDLRLGTTAR